MASWFPFHVGDAVLLKLVETQILGAHPQSFQFSWVWTGAHESAFLTSCPVMLENKHEGSQLDSGKCLPMGEQGGSIPLPWLEWAQWGFSPLKSRCLGLPWWRSG